MVVLPRLGEQRGVRRPHLDGIPGKDETLARYAELTGHPVEHAHWHEVFAAFRYGVVLARVAIRMRAIGASLPSPDWEANNVCTQALARLLDLPPPGEERLTSSLGRRDADTPGAAPVPALGRGRRRLVRARARRRPARGIAGVVDEPDATLEAAVEDWRAVQAGELDRLQAFMDGKLRISGDVTLLHAARDADHAAEPAGREETEMASTTHMATLEDDRRHLPGPNALPLWSESYWFPLYDPEQRDRRRAARRACT